MEWSSFTATIRHMLDTSLKGDHSIGLNLDHDDDNYHGHDNHKYHDPEIGREYVELLSCCCIWKALKSTPLDHSATLAGLIDVGKTQYIVIP